MMMMMRVLLLCALCTPALAIDLDSSQLQDVIDAAATRVHESGKWQQLNALGAVDGGALGFINVATCTPDEQKWVYPTIDAATGLWARVLAKSKLKVAGVKWSGGSGDYKTDPENPTGFWPMYLDAVLAEINEWYTTNIELERIYYDTSDLVLAAVAAGDVDVSEPYYYVNGFIGNKPRVEGMDISCATAGTNGFYYVKAGSGITTVDQLNAAIQNAGSGGLRTVGFTGAGNWHSNQALLDDTTVPVIIADGEEVANQVAAGQLLAAYVSEGNPMDASRFDIFGNGIVSPRAFLFAVAAPAVCDDDSSSSVSMGVMAAVVILAVAVLVLGLLLVYGVMRERSGNPLFMPLIEDPNPMFSSKDMAAAP